MKKSDRFLGMDRAISRRDFLNGASLAIGATLFPALGAPSAAASNEASGVLRDPAACYPPTLTGLRGSHPGSFEVAREMRLVKTWEHAENTGEHYDLIVVGGGLSGLGSAHYFRKALPDATWVFQSFSPRG